MKEYTVLVTLENHCLQFSKEYLATSEDRAIELARDDFFDCIRDSVSIDEQQEFMDDCQYQIIELMGKDS